MKTPPPDTKVQSETPEQIAARYVADLPPSTDCAFNVAKKGAAHRFCSRMGRKPIGRYYFCQRHADVVAKAVLESTGKDGNKDELPKMSKANSIT